MYIFINLDVDLHYLIILYSCLVQIILVGNL